MKSKRNVLIRKRVVVVSLAAAFCATTAGLHAATTPITEPGDFSDDLGNPTVIAPTLEAGTNIIQGYVDGNTWITDNDYFRVTLPSGSALAGVTIRVRNYSNPYASAGALTVQPVSEGNSGSVSVMGDGMQSVSFVIGSPTNIILHVAAPFAAELGGMTSYDYEVELVVDPLEVVSGTAIHTAVEITFPAEAASYYQLQYVNDLSTDEWINVGSPMKGEDGTMSAFDSTRRDSHRFYRVVKQ